MNKIALMSAMAMMNEAVSAQGKVLIVEDADAFKPEPIMISSHGYDFIDKVEIDEHGRRLTRKPNAGFKLGSYRFKSR